MQQDVTIFANEYFVDKLRDWWKKFSYHMFQKEPSFGSTSANTSKHSFSKGSPSVSLTSLRKGALFAKSITIQDSFVKSKQIQHTSTDHISFIR